jgi:hypothetical protein
MIPERRAHRNVVDLRAFLRVGGDASAGSSKKLSSTFCGNSDSFLERVGEDGFPAVAEEFTQHLLFATNVYSYRVEPHDLRLYAAVGGLLVATALAAAFFPARRAARVDRLVALRLE